MLESMLVSAGVEGPRDPAVDAWPRWVPGERAGRRGGTGGRRPRTERNAGGPTFC